MLPNTLKLGRAAGLALALVATLTTSCADPRVVQMTSRPPVAASDGSSQRKVVLFRVVLDIGGRELDDPWSLHLSGMRMFTVVGPANASLASQESFLPGQLGANAASAGWGFVALPAGAYQLQFEGTAIRFTMAGSQFDTTNGVATGRSSPAVFVLPSDGSLFYIGTFKFGCQQLSPGIDPVRFECASQSINDESEQARQVGRLAFDEYGPMQHVPAAPVP